MAVSLIMQLLFESSPNILCAKGNLVFFQATPSVTEQPVLVGDSFVDRRGIQMYGSVIHDQGMFRAWYCANANNAYGDQFDSTLVGYVESDDGITWRKPKLRMVDCGGLDNNLCDLCFGSPSVIIDPDAPPEHRYLATGHIEKRYKGHHREAKPNYRGYYTAYSNDGLHWHLDCEPHGRWRGGDDITTIYHPGRGQVQTLLKRLGFRGGLMKRIWWETKRDANGWAEPWLAIVPDEFTDIAAQARGAQFGDYNNFGLMPAGRATVAFAETHRSRMPLRPHPRGSAYGALGNIDITLAYQHDDGFAWDFPAGRPDFITHGAADWATQTMFCCSNTITVGDEQRLYLTGRNHRHGVGTADQDNSPYTSHFGDQVGYAYWPKWRLFGCQAEPQGVLELDLGIPDGPCALTLNYVAHTDGQIKVDWMHRGEFDRPQDSVELAPDAAVLNSDELEHIVPLNTAPPPGRRLAVRLTMNRATVYAFELRGL